MLASLTSVRSQMHTRRNLVEYSSISHTSCAVFTWPGVQRDFKPAHSREVMVSTVGNHGGKSLNWQAINMAGAHKRRSQEELAYADNTACMIPSPRQSKLALHAVYFNIFESYLRLSCWSSFLRHLNMLYHAACADSSRNSGLSSMLKKWNLRSAWIHWDQWKFP